MTDGLNKSKEETDSVAESAQLVATQISAILPKIYESVNDASEKILQLRDNKMVFTISFFFFLICFYNNYL